MKSSTLTKEQALHAIKTGEFGNEVISSNSRVAVLLTQDWCPQWHYMRNWLYDIELDIDIFELVYNQVDFFDEFRRFKETKWRNGHIPYVRYYVNGVLVKESNYVSMDEFIKNFGE